MNWTEGPSQERHREEEDEHQPTYICTNSTSHQALSRVQGSFR